MKQNKHKKIILSRKGEKMGCNSNPKFPLQMEFTQEREKAPCLPNELLKIEQTEKPGTKQFGFC